MNTLSRYHPIIIEEGEFDYPSMEVTPNGHYVNAADHDAQIAELAEQVRELRQALRMFVEGPLIRTMAERSADLQAATNNARAILAKYQPVTP